MKLTEKVHLTYCSNIHPGETWEEVYSNLRAYLPSIRNRLAPGAPFGIGLRLSARAAETLESPEILEDFQAFLHEHDYYVFTINGFPYGAFHRTRVKEAVYLPDWTQRERLDYTNRLARILATLLPEEIRGSVSTVPGAYKDRVRSRVEIERMRDLLLDHVVFLHELKKSSGKTIALALEPEPCCYLETVDEAVRFFEDHLFAKEALQRLSSSLAVSVEEVKSLLGDHLGLCYDACHMAVEFEDPAKALETLKDHRIPIHKFQISSALRLRFASGDGSVREILGPFAESTYLHQVVERSPRGLVRYTDLPEALEKEAAVNPRGKQREAKEWRVHFHVPIFLERARGLETTQDHLVKLLGLLEKESICPYLEVETYTWDVLPSEYQTEEVDEAVVRELTWVKDRIGS